MNIVRRSAGLAVLVLSVGGSLLCMAGTAGIWVGKRHVDRVVATLFGTADDAFDVMEARLTRLDQTLGASRQRIDDLASRAEQIKAVTGELSTELQPLLQTLDDVYRELESAEGRLESAEALARSINQVSEAIASSKAAAAGGESAGVNARRVAEFSAELVDVLARLAVMREELIRLRGEKVLRGEFAAILLTRATELDGKLEGMSARIGQFNAQVSTAKAASVSLGRTVHWWTAFTTVTLMLVLFWFAVSQAKMVKYGWQLTRLAS